MADAPEAQDRLSDVQAWAADRLGLEHDGTRASVQSAWLRHVADNDFCVDEFEDSLGRVLTGSHVEPHVPDSPPSFRLVRSDGEAHAASELYWHSAVDAFADEFFSLVPTQRSMKWHALHAGALRYGAAVARLNELRAGLDIVPEPVAAGPPKADLLAKEVLCEFVMEPDARAAARRKFLADGDAERAVWIAAARWLRRHRDFAALDTGLLARLAAREPADGFAHVRKFFSQGPKVVTRPATNRRRLGTAAIILGVVVVLKSAFDVISQSPPYKPNDAWARKAQVDHTEYDQTNAAPRGQAEWEQQQDTQTGAEGEIPPVLRGQGFDPEEIRRGVEAYRRFQDIKRQRERTQQLLDGTLSESPSPSVDSIDSHVPQQP
ncbi:MAG: hypothetical protein AB7O59_20450 [Pirellulales bacterium]